MVVWDVDEVNAEAIGEKAATFSAVSHCYLRPKYPNCAPQSFYHGTWKSTEETNAIIEEMAQEIKAKSHMPLYSSREFKKVRIEYFTPEFQTWENSNGERIMEAIKLF